jgi:isoquinoline 1-oxidoreductase beta subunit
MTAALSRRHFLVAAAAAGGGLAFGIRFAHGAQQLAGQEAEPAGFDSWIVISPDNSARLFIPRQEMGQGAFTALSQLIAEELDLDWSTIRPEHASPLVNLTRNRVYGRMNTGGSRGVRENQERMRMAGAVIRLMLVEAAAMRLRVPAAELATANSVITHERSGRKLTYGQVAAAAARLTPPDPATVKLREPGDWKLIGKAMPRIEGRSKVDGSAIFGADLRLPGMKYAAVMFTPVFRGRLKSFDAAAALARPGVHKVVEIAAGETGRFLVSDNGLAVVADSWWQAQSALEAMPKEWDGGDNSTRSSAEFAVAFRNALPAAVEKPLLEAGNIDEALAGAVKIVEADYATPFAEHSAIEPLNCTALVTDERYELWVPTQNPERALQVGARITGLPQESGDVHVTYLGGGFGRRSQPQDFVDQAVQVAKTMKGTPVMLMRSREETMRHAFYRPATMARLRGGLDASGRLVGWRYRIVNQSEDPVNAHLGSVDQPYLAAIPNVLVDHVRVPGHVPMGNMRGVAYAHTIFFIQSFMDELAEAAGSDSYRFQRALLEPELLPADLKARDDTAEQLLRMRTVLDKVAEVSEWTRPLAPGRGRGLAITHEANSALAVVAEITLDGAEWVKVDRMIFAIDCGFAVNPGMIAAQMEGSVGMALTSTLHSEITIKNGRVEQGNFHDYPILRINEMPAVEVHLVPNGRTWGGLGEPGVGVVAPSVANAIYDAGGPRIRSLPLKHMRSRLSRTSQPS